MAEEFLVALGMVALRKRKITILACKTIHDRDAAPRRAIRHGTRQQTQHEISPTFIDNQI
jgi:F0F1-type ATP synthase epsilon subunit